MLLSFYGDDFTGSTDALESVAMAGIPAVLFLDPPTSQQIARFPGIAAVGVAGTSRSRSPEWMSEQLPEVFRRLKALGAPFCHYKTCSTFDSSPQVGSIGRACEIGRDVFGAPVLVVVGVTRLKRFVVFSNLFAAGTVSGNQDIFRIDRHPTMSRHPVTPMREADLRRHLAAQTGRRVEGFDFGQMLAPGAEARLDALMAAGAEIVVLDTFDEATTAATGRLIASRAEHGAVFVAGSSGVEYALARHWAEQGLLPIQTPPGARGAVDRIVAACGSCSPVGEGQIAWAEANGFQVIPVDTVAVIERQADAAPVARLAADIKAGLSNHRGVIFHTARGPADPRIGPTRQALERQGLSGFDSARILGGFLGRTLRSVIAETGLRRAVLAGGDSSSFAATALGIEALDVAGPFVPGAPFCRIHADAAAIDGVEVVLKGGQVGTPEFFGHVLAGRVPSPSVTS